MPTRKKRRSETSKMTISGMKDNPYGFGEPNDQPALSLSVSHFTSIPETGLIMLQGMEDVDKFTFRTQSNTKPVLINQTVNSLGKISTPFVGPEKRTESFSSRNNGSIKSISF